MFPVCSPPRFEAPPVLYPFQVQCVSQPLQAPQPYAPVVYTSAAPSNMVVLNESPTRPPICSQVFLSGNVQGLPQQLISPRMVPPEPRFPPGLRSPQVPPAVPYLNPQLPGSFPSGVPSSQPSQSGQKTTSDTNGNLNRGFPLPTTPYGFLDGCPQMMTCSSDTLLDGSKKEFMITRAEKVSLWRGKEKAINEVLARIRKLTSSVRTFASVFHNGKKTELEATDNALLAVFLGLPSHIRRAIRHQGGIGAFLKECPWFLLSGDKVELVPCMEKLYTCQDDDVTESAEKEEVTERENTADVPETWEDLSISDIEEGGYFGDYVPSEPEISDGESNQKCQNHAEETKTLTEEVPGEIFLVGTEEKDLKKVQQPESGRTEQKKCDGDQHADGGREEKQNGSRRPLDEAGRIEEFAEDADGKVGSVKGKGSKIEEEAVGEKKSPSSALGTQAVCKGLSQDGTARTDDTESLILSGNKSCQELELVVPEENCREKCSSARKMLEEDIEESLAGAGDKRCVQLFRYGETCLSPVEIWDDSDDLDSDELKELFEKVDLGDRVNHENISEGVGESAGGDVIANCRKETESCFKENQGEILSPNLSSNIKSTKDAGTSVDVKKKEKMVQARGEMLKCDVETDVSGLVVVDDDKKESGKDTASQTLDWTGQHEAEKIMVDRSVDSNDLRPVQKTVSSNTEPVLQVTACVNTDPVEEKMECSDRCKKLLASCKSDLKKATAEQIETEGRLCQTVSRLRQVEKECNLLKEIHGSVIADLMKAKEKPQMEEKSTSASLSFDGDTLKKLQKSLSEAKVKLLHGNLKNVELQSKLALQLISQAYEESEIIFSMKKMSISRKASLTTQVMKYQKQLQSHKESVDEWKKKSEAFLMAGGYIEKLPLFPHIDIEKFTPEVSVRGPLRHPSQPSAGDIKLAANFSGQSATSVAPKNQMASRMETRRSSVPLGSFNQSKVSPMSTFIPNKKSDRPGTTAAVDSRNAFNHKFAASVSEQGEGHFIENTGLYSSENGSHHTMGNRVETIENGAPMENNQSLPTVEPSHTVYSQDGGIRSTTPDAKQGITLGEKDTHGPEQLGPTKPTSVDSSVIDFKLEELGPYQPRMADMYTYMQQAYLNQYEYPFCWLGTPLDLYGGQFPVPPVLDYGSLVEDTGQNCDKEQVNMQGEDKRPGQKSFRDVGGDVSSITTGRGDGQEVSPRMSPSFVPERLPSESKRNQESQFDALPRHGYHCNKQDIVKPTSDMDHAVSNTKGVASEAIGRMGSTSSASAMPCSVSAVTQGAVRSDLTHVAAGATNQSSHQSFPFIFGLPSSPESEVNHVTGGMKKEEMQQLPPVTNSLPAATPVPSKPPTMESTSSVQKSEAKQIFADQVTSVHSQKVAVDKSTICPPHQVKSGKRTAAPSLQANIGLDSFDSLSERAPKKKKVSGYLQEETKRTGSAETSAEGKDSEGTWIHMAGKKKKKRGQEQASQKRQEESQVSVASVPGEDEHIPNYFSLTHLLRKLSEMFPDESRFSLTSTILKVRANHRGQLDKVPFAVIISEAVNLLTATDSNEIQNTIAAKKLEDSPEAVDQPSKPTQKSGLLTKLLRNLMEKFPHKERSDLIDGIVRVRHLHGNTLSGMTMAQVLFEVSQYLHNLETELNQTDKQNGEDKDCCIICLAPLKVTQLVRELECAHRFHDECIHLWFEKRERTCPVCRSHALLEDDFPRLH